MYIRMLHIDSCRYWIKKNKPKNTTFILPPHLLRAELPILSGSTVGEKQKGKKCFCTRQTSPIAPGTLSASCSPLPPRGPYYYIMNRKSFAKEWKWSQMNAYWDLWFYILISIKKFLKPLARDSISHLNIINTYFPPYQGLVHFLGFTYPLAEHS